MHSRGGVAKWELRPPGSRRPEHGSRVRTAWDAMTPAGSGRSPASEPPFARTVPREEVGAGSMRLSGVLFAVPVGPNRGQACRCSQILAKKEGGAHAVLGAGA
jgi:hypothetical protein